MLFKKKEKKEEPHKGDIFLAKGIYLKQPVMNNGNIILNCFLRCMIVFLLVFGSVGGFLSAFDISYNYMLVIVFYLVLSMYFSFLYASSKMLYRDMGYLLFFAIFVMTIYQLRLYANSGFYVIINTVLRYARTFFDLPGIREYETQITNDYLTVAIVAIFVGMVMIIILNIWIYSTMSLIWTVLLTFPILFIPLYMKLAPDSLYVIALCVGYAAVMVFKANGHFLAFAWDAPFRIRGLKKDRVSYTQDAGIFRQLLLSITALAFCMIVLVGSLFPARRFEAMFKNDRLREKTAESIGNFILLGFDGMYNQYSATGGISGGKLGGISNVRPDYLTDLIVSYTPYSNQAVYLKAYTGGVYGDNQWLSVYADDVGENIETQTEEQISSEKDSRWELIRKRNAAIFESESMKKEADILKEAKINGDEYSAIGRMDIKNVGAEMAYLYYPYYTLFEDNRSGDGIDLQQENSYYYYPKIQWEESIGNVSPNRIDTDSVDSIYLDVPQKNKEVIQNECDKIGLTADMTENEIFDAVRDYFAANIPYTLRPGSTPHNQDFINYFLTRNRKGYCAHFASAATLIFRQMGIPARYVEGYAFTLEAALDSDINQEKAYTNYYEGYSGIGESAVVDVEVSDAMAHAWVEVYVEGFGWKVVEVTPGSNEVTDEDDFWTAFSNFLNGIGGTDENDDNDTGGNLSLSEYSWLIYVIVVILLTFLLFMVGRISIRKISRYRKCHQKDKIEAVIACYADVCDMVRVCESDFALCRSHMEQLVYINMHYQVDFDKEHVCRLLEQISFSKEAVSTEELDKVRELIDEIRKAIWKNVNFKKKMMLYRR